ncbi:MAG: hypothetical protein V8S98_12565 [Lachnospiraceae bacterium]
MLNVLIADDESKVCQLIEKLVDWPSLGMQVGQNLEWQRKGTNLSSQQWGQPSHGTAHKKGNHN